MKSQEFLSEINLYMRKYACTFLKDIDKAEDVVQYAWQEVLENKKFDLSRPENEVKAYLLTAVRYVVKNRSRLAHATGTNLNDGKNLINMTDLQETCYKKPDSWMIDSHHTIYDRAFPQEEQGFALAEIAHDVKKVFKRLSLLEQKFFSLVLSGIPKTEAASMCNRTDQWGYNLCGKVYRLVENI